MPAGAPATKTAVLSDGSYLVFFHDNGDGFPNGTDPEKPSNVNPFSIPPDGDNSYAQKFDPSGNPIDAPFFIHTPSNPGSQYDPKVLQFENGEFVVVWSNAGAPLGTGIGYQRFSFDGQPLGFEEVIPGEDPGYSKILNATTGNGFKTNGTQSKD